MRLSLVSLAPAIVASMLSSATWGKNIRGRKKFKNVIIMIPDGCDETVQTVARWYKGKDLQLDRMESGKVKQHMANSVITGSAAAATAFATGMKTTVRFLGVGPRTDDLLAIYDKKDMMAPPYAPVASVLEAAKWKGKATGLVATSRVTHATPAAFACHIHDRDMDNEIMQNIVYNNVTVVFGGGKRHLLPEDSCPNAVEGGKREDCENLLQVLRDRGYKIVETREEMLTLRTGKAYGMFNQSHMQPDMDRKHFAPEQPSLAEMTEKAIQLLSKNKEGFLLVVEGSQVDWAGHNNDPVYMVQDFIAFDDAVKISVNFARKNKNTLVIAFPDHNTGGLKFGNYEHDDNHTDTTIEQLVGPLRRMTMTANGLVTMMGEDQSKTQVIRGTVKEYWGLDITKKDVDDIKDYMDRKSQSLSYALARILSERYTRFGWTTHGHNGETVPVWVFGDEAPREVIDNTDLAFIVADAMNLKLGKVTSKLYVDLDTTRFRKKYIVDMTDEKNPILVVNETVFPIGKDFMTYDGKTIMLPGLTVYATLTGKVYISRQGLAHLRELGV